MADSSVTRRPPHTGRARFRKIPSLFALEKCQSGSDMGSPQVGFCAGRHCLASGAWWGLSGRSGCEVQVWGLTTPQAIPAGYPGHRSTRRLPVTASGLPRQGLGVQCPAGSEPPEKPVWGGGHAVCPGLAGMAAYPQQPVTVGSRPERLEMRSLATSSAQVGWMPTVRITCW